MEILFKDDFIPWIVKNQYHNDLVELYRNLTTGKGLGYSKKDNSITIKAFISDKIYLRRANNLKDYYSLNMDSLRTAENLHKIFKATINTE